LFKVDEVRVSVSVELTPSIAISIFEPLILERRIRFGVLIWGLIDPITLIVLVEFLILNL